MNFKYILNRLKTKYRISRSNDETLADFIHYDLVELLKQQFFTKKVSYSANGSKCSIYHHLFIHSLVLDESKAFLKDNDSAHDFESWFVTKNEFRALLQSLYDRGYVLVKIAELLKGHVSLEPGKIPLILSFDDMNYYDYMKGFGFADKLELNREDESVTVLESFVRDHPDFSYNGARGIIALTGYEGALGYRDTEDPDLQELIKNLKDMGFEFACHSWGHHHRIYSDTNPHGKKGIIDMEKWFAGVGKAVGKTDIFITPFGVDIRNNPILHRYLKRKGFRYFCNVGNTHSTQKCGNCYYMERFNIDGLSMLKDDYDYNMYYGNPKEFYSSARQKEYEPLKKDATSLVKHAKFCLKIPTIYLWDSMGETASLRFLRDKRIMYPDVYKPLKFLKYASRIDGEIRAFDCSGLIKCFMMGGLYNFKYDPSLDFNSAGLLEHSTKNGDISTLPELPGVCLYMKGHVGIYVGNGKVVESTPNPKFGNGVLTTKLSDRNWEKWFYCPEIDY